VFEVILLQGSQHCLLQRHPFILDVANIQGANGVVSFDITKGKSYFSTYQHCSNACNNACKILLEMSHSPSASLGVM